MAIGHKIQLIGDEKYRRALVKSNPKKNRRTISDALERIANLVSAGAKLNIVRGRQSQPPLADKLTFRKGGAVGSIGIDLSGLPRWSEAGSIFKYPMIHELGLGRFPVRQWLQPAVDDVIPRQAEGIAAQFWEGQVRFAQ